MSSEQLKFVKKPLTQLRSSMRWPASISVLGVRSVNSHNSLYRHYRGVLVSFWRKASFCVGATGTVWVWFYPSLSFFLLFYLLLIFLSTSPASSLKTFFPVSPNSLRSTQWCTRMLFVGCLTSQQRASVFQGRSRLDKRTHCHTKREVADQTFYLTQSQYSDTRHINFLGTVFHSVKILCNTLKHQWMRLQCHHACQVVKGCYRTAAMSSG